MGVNSPKYGADRYERPRKLRIPRPAPWAGLAHSAARPFPTRNASLVSRGSPNSSTLLPAALYRFFEELRPPHLIVLTSSGCEIERPSATSPARSAPLRAARSCVRTRTTPFPPVSTSGGSKGGANPPFVSLGRGETGEAPPAADEASLFRGWPPIGGPTGLGIDWADGGQAVAAPTFPVRV